MLYALPLTASKVSLLPQETFIHSSFLLRHRLAYRHLALRLYQESYSYLPLPPQPLIKRPPRQHLRISPPHPPHLLQRTKYQRNLLPLLPQPRQLPLPLLQLPSRNPLLPQENRYKLIAPAGTGVYALLQLLPAIGIIVGRGGGGWGKCQSREVDELGLWDREAGLLLDLLGGAAGEGAAVVEHAGWEFGEGERAGGDAGLEGEDDLFVGFGGLRGIVGLED